ncbi:hypothetical protein Trisim1_002469 [Trichoderma cf. simile WF8]
MYLSSRTPRNSTSNHEYRKWNQRTGRTDFRAEAQKNRRKRSCSLLSIYNLPRYSELDTDLSKSRTQGKSIAEWSYEKNQVTAASALTS